MPKTVSPDAETTWIVNAPFGQLSALDVQSGAVRWSTNLADALADEIVEAGEPVMGLDVDEGTIPQEGGTGGGSDGNFTGAIGVPTLDGLGMPGDGAHADHEHIEVDQIASRTALLAACLLAL